MKVKYTFKVYAYTFINGDGDSEISKIDAERIMKRLLNWKSDFSDVDFELIETSLENE